MHDPGKTEISVPEARSQGGSVPDASGRARRIGRNSAPAAAPVVDRARTQVTPEPPEETSDPSGEAPVAPPEPSGTVGLTAAELGASLRDARAGYEELSGADKGTLWASLGLVGSTLLPFVGVPGDPWRPGVMAGGWALVLMAVWALQLVGARSRLLGIVGGSHADLEEHEGAELRRISLKQLFCGALATTYTVYLAVFHAFLMDARTIEGRRLVPLLRPGLAVALFFSTGLAYAGLARFRADGRRRREAQA